MLQLEAVLFDLDGTLIHSIDHIVSCWQHTVRTCLGREIAREEVLPTVGKALLESFEEIAPGRAEELREVYRAYQKSTHDHMIKLVPGVRETLQRLKNEGFMLGVVTAKGLPSAVEGLDLFELTPFLDTLVTYEDTTRHKPYPDPVLAACDRLGVGPWQAIYVGDSVFDVKAGKAAGTLTAGVTWGAGARQDLLEAAPDYMLESMIELEVVAGLGEKSSYMRPPL